MVLTGFSTIPSGGSQHVPACPSNSGRFPAPGSDLTGATWAETTGKFGNLGVVLKWGDHGGPLKMDKNLSETPIKIWMMTGGTPISGKLHVKRPWHQLGFRPVAGNNGTGLIPCFNRTIPHVIVLNHGFWICVCVLFGANLQDDAGWTT